MSDTENIFPGTSIAVVGMAGRFPGARNIREFWRNLRDGVESISALGDEQLIAAGASPADLGNPEYVRAAAILDDIDRFDAAFFGLSPRDAAIMDPQHRLFLECAWEALENAGWCAEEFAGRIGVYAGSGMNTYLIHNLLSNAELVANAGLFLLKQTGNDKDVLATRVSYQLNLTGPSLSVQTACSTLLVAIHLACQGLLNHECDMAMAGGVTIEIPHGLGYIYREGEILSRDGHCRSFDATSSGTIFGSGMGIVVLRRLDDAIRDGDFIRAVIRGTAINNDGARKVSYLAPSVAGQADAIAEALTVADVSADSISYVEAHGTGTIIGDPIEVAALTRAFRSSTERNGFCAIGSVKTNVGHLDAAAGVAGFIKTILALENRQIPPSLNFAKPNPLIDFERSPFYVNTGLRDWERNGQPRRAGVTSLGIGGTNAHAIVEEAPGVGPSGPSRPWQLLTIGEDAVRARSDRPRPRGASRGSFAGDRRRGIHHASRAQGFPVPARDRMRGFERRRRDDRPRRLEESNFRFVFRERAAGDFSMHRPGRAVRFGGTGAVRIRAGVQSDGRLLCRVSRTVHRARPAQGPVPVRRRGRGRGRVDQPDAPHSTGTVRSRIRDGEIVVVLGRRTFGDDRTQHRRVRRRLHRWRFFDRGGLGDYRGTRAADSEHAHWIDDGGADG